MTPDFLDLQNSIPVLLATCEVLTPSMNGKSANRLTMALDDLTYDGSYPMHPDDGMAKPGMHLDETDREWLKEGLGRVTPDRIAFWTREFERLEASTVRIVRCFDGDYPANLRLIHDRPPLLFVRGSLTPADSKAIAIVGARKASPEGQQFAYQLAAGLATEGVTIASGLAVGIDAAAHSGAIEAGGRTLAVFGTTIDKIYPAVNTDLARRVERSGAYMSQFLPNQPTGPWSFPVRNVVTSGLSIGSVVVEASESSGARHQANSALAHGKGVFLVKQFVMNQRWAQEMAHKNDAHVVSDVDEVMSLLRDELEMSADEILV